MFIKKTFTEEATDTTDIERLEMLIKAKNDYESAVNRFNYSEQDELTDLAIFDMNTSMKRVCVIIKA